MPRVHTQKKSARGQKVKCGRCGAKINPGEQYMQWSFRYGGTHYRCMKVDCRPRQSELTQGRIGDIYAQQEAMEDAILSFRQSQDFETFKSDVESVISELESLADEFDSSFNNMPEGLQQGPTGQLLEGRVESVNEFKDEIESAIEGADWDEEVATKAEEEEEAQEKCTQCGGEEEAAVHNLDDDTEQGDHHAFIAEDSTGAREKLTEMVEDVASALEGVSYNGE